MSDVQTVSCGNCGTPTIDTISGICISCRPFPATLPAASMITEADVMLAGIHAVCVGASQEYTRCKGMMPQWDSGFFAGQMHVFDMYTKADKTAVSEANEYLSKLNEAAPLPAAPAPTEQAEELPPLPKAVAKFGPDSSIGEQFVYVSDQMWDYARAALAHQMSRIRHLEHERDTARKDCAALAARQAPAEALKELTPSDMPVLPQHLLNIIGDYGLARTDGLSELQRMHLWETLIAAIKNYAWAARQAPDSRDAALNLCDHTWELQPVSSSVRMTEKCRFCHVIREIAVAQEKAQ